MEAKVGDRIVVESERVGLPTRVSKVLEVLDEPLVPRPSSLAMSLASTVTAPAPSRIMKSKHSSEAGRSLMRGFSHGFRRTPPAESRAFGESACDRIGTSPVGGQDSDWC